jgi:hypothetical protein
VARGWLAGSVKRGLRGRRDLVRDGRRGEAGSRVGAAIVAAAQYDFKPNRSSAAGVATGGAAARGVVAYFELLLTVIKSVFIIGMAITYRGQRRVQAGTLGWK